MVSVWKSLGMCIDPLGMCIDPLEYVWETIGWEPLGTPGRTGMCIIDPLIFSQ